MKMSDEFISVLKKFKDNSNFEYHFDKLKKLSELDFRGYMKHGELDVPIIGPDPKIFEYEQKLDNWECSDVQDFCFLRDLYYDRLPDTPEFFIKTIDHLLTFQDNNILVEIKKCLEQQREPYYWQVQELLSDNNNRVSKFGLSIFGFYFFTEENQN